MRELLLGIDLGTSSVKTALFDRAGAHIASASAAYPTAHPQESCAEQSPEEWWQALCRAMSDLRASRFEANEIRAIGLSGQMHGTVQLQRDGSTSPAIIWQDRRSAAQASAITAEVGEERLIAIAGSPISAGFQAATLRWLAEEQPQQLAEARAVLLPKDWLGWRMTGSLCTDPSDAAGTLLFDTCRGDWSPPLLEAARTERSLLPEIQESTALRGTLLPAAAEQLGLAPDTPVCVGAADTACALLAACGIAAQTLVLNLGTGGQLVLPLAAPSIDQGGRLHTFRSALPVDSGAGWYLMGATLAAAYALQWWVEKAMGGADAATIETLLAEARTKAAGSDGLLFLPYLVGERTPHMDAHARAAFIGLTDAHGRAQMTRAVLEGATFAVFEAWRTMATMAPVPATITLAGGGARSRLWQQIVADVFGLPVRRLLAAEQSAWGAALLAGEAIGWWQASAQASACVRLDEVVRPHPAAQHRYTALFPLFQRAYQVNRDLMHELT